MTTKMQLSIVPMILAYLSIPSHSFLPSHRHRSITQAPPPTSVLYVSDEGPRSSPRRSASRADRPRRPPPTSRSRVRPSGSNTESERRRAPHQFDHTKEEARPFLDDPASVIRQQSPNEDAPLYIFPEDEAAPIVPDGSHIVSMSLDDLFPDLDISEIFCKNGSFRQELRNAMREDIFDSTPAYSGMSEKARRMLLLPDSSLQGSWNCRQFINGNSENGNESEHNEGPQLRMKKLTQVLSTHLGNDAPTGDEFMEKMGSLCGSKPSTHWIDIVGIVDRTIPHSWHQDTGRSHNGDSCTVLLGFPREDDYDGVGVFSHAVKLKRERVAKEDHPQNEPVVYPKMVIEEEYIVRPRFAKGSEVILFRDIDVLHSSPDIAYRESVMRFM